MFNAIKDSMTTIDKVHYRDVVLPFMLREFRDLKYVLDPEHEISVLNDCISNLIAYSICVHGSYADILWLNAYGVQPLKIQPTHGYTYRQYADQAEATIDHLETGSNSVHELIRLIICYAKVKGYDIETIFVNKCK